MRKIATAVAIILALSTTAAHADYRHRGGGGWAAPLVGGLIVGGIVGGALAQPRPYYYEPQPVIVQPPYRTQCRTVPAYDRWGYYVGDRRECWREYY